MEIIFAVLFYHLEDMAVPVVNPEVSIDFLEET
jgi:hypothetical protein